MNGGKHFLLSRSWFSQVLHEDKQRIPGGIVSFEQEMKKRQNGPHKAVQPISPFLPFLFKAYCATRYTFPRVPPNVSSLPPCLSFELLHLLCDSRKFSGTFWLLPILTSRTNKSLMNRRRIPNSKKWAQWMLLPLRLICDDRSVLPSCFKHSRTRPRTWLEWLKTQQSASLSKLGAPWQCRAARFCPTYVLIPEYVQNMANFWP